MRMSSKQSLVIDKMTVWMVGYTYLKVSKDLMRLMALPGFDIDSDMGRTIQSLRYQYINEVKSCQRIAKNTKPGRPKKRIEILYDPPQGLISIPIQQKPAKKPVGRPTKRPKDWNLRVFEQIEAERKVIADNNLSKPTVAAAIESRLRQVAKNLGRRETRVLKIGTNFIKAAYARGKKAVNTKENQN